MLGSSWKGGLGGRFQPELERLPFAEYPLIPFKLPGTNWFSFMRNWSSYC
jgi:hypothetical protein